MIFALASTKQARSTPLSIKFACGSKPPPSMLVAVWTARCATRLLCNDLARATSEPLRNTSLAADPTLTDSATAATRPAPNENYLLINAYTTHPQSPLLLVTRRIADSGCNLVDSRLSTVGRDVSVTALAVGPWDAIAKLEAMLTRLEREEGIKLIWYRTGPKPVQSNLLPYVVEVVAADKPGILYQLADFFDRQGITIESLHCARYRAMQTGADMFSAQVTIGVPADMHIAALRDDFLEFCDHLNLDAIMDPMKF